MLDTFIAFLDWLGIAVFAVTGALVASRKQMDVVGFGVIRDVLGGEIPVILRREIYATAALAGSVAFVGMTVAGAGEVVAAFVGFAACFTVRGLALYRGWSLPAYKARPGRSPDELGL